MSARASRPRVANSSVADRKRSKRHGWSSAVGRACEPLECRRFLCADHLAQSDILELAPETINPETGISDTRPDEVADPADIVWVNRGQASDGFAARFGTLANQARAVVDAVIDNFEVMIGSFNYPTSGQTYSLTLSMGAAGGGFGASAGLSTSLGGKPKSGGITMGAGNGSADPNDDNGWFIDPTPYDNNEFQGAIVNAFSGDAHAGSPAAGKGDFFTVVAAEMAHCMGLFGSTLAGWHNLTTNTGIADNASPPGTFWTFSGPSIKHLMTSDNGGFQDWGSAIHSSEGPGANINFNGTNWIGAHDIGNPFYEFGRRYMVNKTFQLMFKDAYGYSTTEIGNWGTFYSSPFETGSGIVRVRGGTGTSADNIQIFRSAGNTLTVAVDVGNDVAGTGALPGAGNLPAWVHVYDINSVSQIIVDAGAGDDDIFIDTTNFSASLTESISINAGTGNDSLTTTFFGGNLDFIQGPVSFDGGTGSDQIVIYDTAATFNDTYTLTPTTLSRVVFGGLTYAGTEALFLNGETGNNTFNVTGVASGVAVTLNGRNGNDIFNVGTAGGNAEGIDGALTVNGENGTDSVNYNDLTAGGTVNYTLDGNTVQRSNNATLTYGTAENLTVHASNGSNLVTLGAPPATNNPTLVINGNDGNDAFTASVSSSNGGFGGQFNGNGGTDSMTVNDAQSNVFIGIHADAFLGGLVLRQHNYATMESLTYNATSGGADTFNLFSTASGTTYTINANAGNDSFAMGGFLNNVNGILGATTVNGGVGNDTLNINDQGSTAAHLHSLITNGYTRSGIAAVTYGTTEALNLNAGSGHDSLDVIDHAAGMTVTLDAGAGQDFVGVNSDGVGTSNVRFATTQDLAAIEILPGGTATVNPGGSNVLDTKGLTITGTGKLDLNDNDMIVDYAFASQYTAIRNMIAAARAGGAWSGNGITSTAAKNAPQDNTTLGVMEASDFKSIYGTSATFAGRTIDSTAVLVKYTYYGDADFSGTVDFDDYVRTDAGFNTNGTTWTRGDFDGSGGVDFDDYVLIDLAFNTQGGTL